MPADYEAVIAFAKSNGLTVLRPFANRTLLDVSGSVADIEKAFMSICGFISTRQEKPDFFRARH